MYAIKVCLLGTFARKTASQPLGYLFKSFYRQFSMHRPFRNVCLLLILSN